MPVIYLKEGDYSLTKDNAIIDGDGFRHELKMFDHLSGLGLNKTKLRLNGNILHNSTSSLTVVGVDHCPRAVRIEPKG